MERRAKDENQALSKWLNDKKYGPRRRLKKKAFKKYRPAYKQLKRAGTGVTYRAIAYKVWPKIKHHNIHPVTEKNIIGRDTEHKFPADVIKILIRWFSEGVRDKVLKSPRKK